MGDWAYLRSDSGLEFEAKNHVPHLWVAMLDAATFDAALPELWAAWEAVDVEGDEPLEDPGIAMPLGSALATYRQRSEFIVRLQPEVEPLLDDFGRFVSDHGASELRIYNMTFAFMESDFEAHIARMWRTVEKLDAGEIWGLHVGDVLNPHHWIGVEVPRSDGPFMMTSTAYREAVDTWDRRHETPRRPPLDLEQPKASDHSTDRLRDRFRQFLRPDRRV